MKSNITTSPAVLLKSQLQFYGCMCIFFVFGNSFGQNPLITSQFTADPTARVFKGKLYIYPSHDIIPPKGEGRPDWFNMADYHAFSTKDLTHWKDHGVILSQEQVAWADPKAYSMWAPDAVEHNGNYYFYFPTRVKEAVQGEGGFSIGVAISEDPQGPFMPQDKPIKGVKGIDPNVLIDKDGQAYLYWSLGKIYGARLKDNMLELDAEPKIFDELPQKGLIEGPFVFERNGIYYMTYPHVAGKTERLEYATSSHPLGPFTHRGVLMDESASGTWTNHHSITKFKNQWYLFYHDNDLSVNFDKNRSIRADSLFFKENGSIVKVIPSLRGVGKSSAYEKIQFDRWSSKSDMGVESRFLNEENPFLGWMLVFNQSNSFVRYNVVDFGSLSPKFIKLKIKVSQTVDAKLEIRDTQGNKIVAIDLENTDGFETLRFALDASISGVKDLIMEVNGAGIVMVDWIRFEK